MIDVRHFDGGIVRDPIGPGWRLISDPLTAVYVDGRLDRVEWSHEDRAGNWRYVAPASAVARLFALESGSGDDDASADVGP